MARRVSLPAADDLFRPTADPVVTVAEEAAEAGTVVDASTTSPPKKAAPRKTPARKSAAKSASSTPAKAEPAAKKRAAAAAPASDDAPAAKATAKKSSGRVRHDEKMTVYVTSDELLDLEHARLMLRRQHGLAVDRGRIVREAIAMVLAEFEELGEDSALVRRLIEE